MNIAATDIRAHTQLLPAPEMCAVCSASRHATSGCGPFALRCDAGECESDDLQGEEGNEMIIVSDETHGEYRINKCENCGKMKPARWIPTCGIVGESRGSHMICFDCFGPVVIWYDSRNIVFETPASMFSRRAASTATGGA